MLFILDRNFSFIIVLLMLLQACGGGTSPDLVDDTPPGEDTAPLKVAFVYVGPRGDAGWTYAHDKGRLHLESILNDKVKTTFIESVAEGADSERVINQLARSGNKLIFATSFGYMNPVLAVAKRYPDVIFEHATGYKRAANVGTYFDRAYEGRYLGGMVAGAMTKTNTLGYVASFPIPEVIRAINAFTLGAQSVNPKVKVKVVWVSTWYDPAREREAAETMIIQGADVITQHTDSAGPIAAADSNGVYAIGYNSDMSVYGESAHLTAVVHDWGPLYVEKTLAVINGTWFSEDVWPGLSSGVVGLSEMHTDVPDRVVDKVAEIKAAIIDGNIHPFMGPIYDQANELRVPANTVMTDEELLEFNWYVKGIEGNLP